MKKINNKGAALISVMIAITFISIVATTLLVITFNNYQMKVVNSQSKSNFYETEQRMNVVTAQIRNTIVSSTDVNGDVGGLLNGGTGLNYNVTTPIPYKAEKIAELAFPGETVSTEGTKAYVQVGPDRFYFTDGNFQISEKTNGKEVTIQNVTVTQVSNKASNSSEGEYENTIKSDIKFYVEIPQAGGGPGGGIGSCAFLLDNTIQIDSSDHASRLNIAGNTIMGKYNLLNSAYDTWYLNGSEQTSEAHINKHSEPVSISKTKSGGTVSSVNTGTANANNAIIYLNSTSFMNFNSDYNVILGDVYLKDMSVLNVIDGQFTVYGDIFVETKAAFVCKGKLSLGYNCGIYSVNPSNGSCTKITGNTPDKNIVCGTINYLDKKNYDKMADHLKLMNDDPKDDGILPNILKKANGTGGNNVSGGRYCYESYNSGGKVSGELAKFDGISYKAAIPEGDLNGNYKNQLIFVSENLNNPELKVTQNTPGCTIISIKPVYAYDTQNICVSKMGDRAFNYILKNGGNFTFKVKNDSGNDSGDITYNVKDFFRNSDVDGYCNAFVQSVFNISSGGDGGATGPTTPTKTRIEYTKWVKE